MIMFHYPRVFPDQHLYACPLLTGHVALSSEAYQGSGRGHNCKHELPCLLSKQGWPKHVAGWFWNWIFQSFVLTFPTFEWPRMANMGWWSWWTFVFSLYLYYIYIYIYTLYIYIHYIYIYIYYRIFGGPNHQPDFTTRSRLGGLANFPLTYNAVPGYCGWPNSVLSPVAQFDLSYLASASELQLTSGLYSNTEPGWSNVGKVMS